MATDAELQRICAPLYASFALESLASISLFFFFSYLSILISSKQQLKTPARSMCRFACYHLTEWITDTIRILSRWDRMNEMDLGQRFRYCRRLNATICRFSAAAALFAVTRWLHINNVNGFRYLGYAVTCPMMQGELVLLIAPVVPNYSGMFTRTCIATFLMLVCGYISSQFEGKIWETDFNDVFIGGNFGSITAKGWFVLPSTLLLFFLSFVQIPYLAFLYCVRGGADAGLPEGYLKLLLITSVTWLGFPIWWFLSYEGMSVITDTKLNGIGFVLLNVISKGGFTLQMMSMVKAYKRSHPPPPEGGGPQLRSMNTLPNFDDEEEEEIQRRRMKQIKTGQSLDWMIKGLKRWDSEDAGEVPHHGEHSAQSAVDTSADQESLLDTSRISDEQMMQELARRMRLQACFDGEQDSTTQESHNQNIDERLRMACTTFLDEVEDDEL